MDHLRLPPASGVHVLVVGDIMLDRYVQGRTDRLSPEAPVPVVAVQGSENRLGGAANVARNVVAMGGRCTLIGVVGDDRWGRVVTGLLQDAGVEADLVVAADWPTTLKERVVSRHKQLLRLDFETPVPPATADEVAKRVARHVSRFDTLVIEDYDKGAVAAPSRLIDAAGNAPVVADPKHKPFRAYRGARVLKPNRPEFERALGYWPAAGELGAVGCQLARQCGVDAIALTRGGEGLTLFEASGNHRHIAAVGVDVYDSTGAGDTVAATLGICAALGWPHAQSAAVANVAGGLACSEFGTAAVAAARLNQALGRQEERVSGVGRELIADTDHSRSLERVVDAVARARRHGERIVFTNGCFDILHAGHVGYLAEARALGDRLVVAVNDDASARRLKGAGRPVVALERRMQVLAALAAVDWVVPFATDTPEPLIAALRPDVLVKGGDYRTDEVVGAEQVRHYGGEVRVLQLVEGCSTSNIVARIKAASR